MTTDDTTTTTEEPGRAEAPEPRWPRLRRPASRWVQPVIALLIAVTAGVLFLVSGQMEKESPTANRALVDAAATAKVAGDVGNALTRIFTYSFEDLDATESAAKQLLDGRASDQYAQMFASVRQQAPAQRLAQDTRVVRTGVSRLTPDTARLLVFLDQSSSRAGKPAGSAAAQLTVTARLVDGQWRITELKSS